jgi:hypothetical protein
VVATVRRRLSRSKEGTQKFEMERFNLQKLNAEFKHCQGKFQTVLDLWET